jgi:hypothetical protein
MTAMVAVGCSVGDMVVVKVAGGIAVSVGNASLFTHADVNRMTINRIQEIMNGRRIRTSFYIQAVGTSKNHATDGI